MSRKKIEFYSQYGQDKYLDEEIFKKKKNGIFLEIGAHDGITYSNTYFFEKYRKWKGICIEPNPDVYKLLSKNRKVKNINACISNFEGVVNYVKVTGYSEMLSGIKEFYEDAHWQRLENELVKYGGSKEIIQVQSYKLTTILKKSHFLHRPIDYCSIDVEGSELDILKSIDFDQVQIRILSVENNFKTDTVRNFLASKGYKLIKEHGADDFFEKEI